MRVDERRCFLLLIVFEFALLVGCYQRYGTDVSAVVCRKTIATEPMGERCPSPEPSPGPCPVPVYPVCEPCPAVYSCPLSEHHNRTTDVREPSSSFFGENFVRWVLFNMTALVAILCVSYLWFAFAH